MEVVLVWLLVTLFICYLFFLLYSLILVYRFRWYKLETATLMFVTRFHQHFISCNWVDFLHGFLLESTAVDCGTCLAWEHSRLQQCQKTQSMARKDPCVDWFPDPTSSSLGLRCDLMDVAQISTHYLWYQMAQSLCFMRITNALSELSSIRYIH